jgi:hypothetical protein
VYIYYVIVVTAEKKSAGNKIYRAVFFLNNPKRNYSIRHHVKFKTITSSD